MPATDKISTIASIITEKYLADKPDASFVNCVYDKDEKWNYNFFSIEVARKRGTGIHISEIVNVVTPKLPSFSVGIKLHKKKIEYSEKTGLFKIILSDGSFMYIAKWFGGLGRNRIIESLCGAENSVWIKILSLRKQHNNRQIKPKIGTFKVEMSDFGLVYTKLKKIPNNIIYHNELDKIKNSVNYYFANIPSFMKYNQAGRRSILIYGEPGTSKTSTLYQLAREHNTNKSVCFFTDIGALMAHVKLCEKYSVPTLAFLEDCDATFRYNSPEIKGFLSGMYAGKNKSGTCMVFTTNYPERLEETIIERPERVDEMYYVGPISGDMLVSCAKYYFGEHAPADYILQAVLSKEMTGAEVKLFVENTLKYCAAHQVDVAKDVMEIVLNNYRDDVKQLKTFIKKNPHKTFVKMSEDGDNKMGFQPSASPMRVNKKYNTEAEYSNS